ncbi:hypothetical protein [Polaromonas sp.]|uniref:hypothetical protein n=1 Tax=Polaromonas sp. TaxID=1869339 RepID=UPI00326355F4
MTSRVILIVDTPNVHHQVLVAHLEAHIAGLGLSVTTLTEDEVRLDQVERQELIEPLVSAPYEILHRVRAPAERVVWKEDDCVAQWKSERKGGRS